jgi:transposase-like protein
MDTSEQTIFDETPKREARRRSVEEKRRIVEETLEAGASVARVARRHAVNANQVFYWRKKYREGQLSKRQSSKLLLLGLVEQECLLRWPFLSAILQEPGNIRPRQAVSAPSAPSWGLTSAAEDCHRGRDAQCSDTPAARSDKRCTASVRPNLSRISIRYRMNSSSYPETRAAKRKR